MFLTKSVFRVAMDTGLLRLNILLEVSLKYKRIFYRMKDFWLRLKHNMSTGKGTGRHVKLSTCQRIKKKVVMFTN